MYSSFYHFKSMHSIRQHFVVFCLAFVEYRSAVFIESKAPEHNCRLNGPLLSCKRHVKMSICSKKCGWRIFPPKQKITWCLNYLCDNWSLKISNGSTNSQIWIVTLIFGQELTRTPSATKMQWLVLVIQRRWTHCSFKLFECEQNFYQFWRSASKLTYDS